MLIKLAWNVDLYVYLCPECNTVATTMATTLSNAINSNGLKINYIWLDVELCPPQTCWANAATGVSYLQGVIQTFAAHGLKVGFYSSEGEWSETVANSVAFAQYPLWYAHFDGVSSFSDESGFGTFGGWSTNTIVMKQYVGCTTVCAIGVDLDYYPVAPSTPPVQCKGVYVANADAVNFRDAPGLNSNVLFTINTGDVVYDVDGTVTALDGYNWIHVMFGGSTGYVASTFLTFSANCPSTLCVNANPGLNLRTAACTTASVILTIPNKAPVTTTSAAAVTACGFTWRQIVYMGNTGFAASGFLVSCPNNVVQVLTPNATFIGPCMTVPNNANALSFGIWSIVATVILSFFL